MRQISLTFLRICATSLFSVAGGVFICLALGNAAHAHSVYIFAWPDGNRICTESYFSKNSKVRGGEVSMLSAAGERLATGITDSSGQVCFAPPEEDIELLFIVVAGQGHRGEFLMPAPDVAPVRANAAVKAAPPENKKATSSNGLAEKQNTSPVATSFDLASIRAVVREEIQREMAPLRHALAEQRHDASPGFRDIMGGLGWIAGLAGLGAFYAARRKRS